MSDPEDPDNVLVFRNPAGQPVAVPAQVVTEAERAYRCYMMNLGGKSWHEIAVLESYPSASAAKYDVDRYMEEARAMIVEASQQKMLVREVARLDYLQDRIWPGVQAGSLAAVQQARGIIMDRVKLIEAVAMLKHLEGGASHNTVVIGSYATADKESYIGALAAAAGDTPRTSSTDTAPPSAARSTVIQKDPTKE
jgi:hypothetical protein